MKRPVPDEVREAQRSACDAMRVAAVPALHRTPIAPRARAFTRAKMGDSHQIHRAAVSPDPHGHWRWAGTRRRMALLALVVFQSLIATHYMAAVLPYHGTQPLELAVLALFVILFAWISAGFWTAMMGFLVLLRGDRYGMPRRAARPGPIDRAARTAIVMPICNESVQRVFAGLSATYRSLEKTGEIERFDFFVLSDSSDPDARVAEAEAWREACADLAASGRLFYRWRRQRIKKKAGNVGDFCRRWGSAYRYMIVLDADSVMSGECLTTLVRLMEANPNAGIVQTAPRAAGRETLYARMQQFACRLYGPLFTAGMHYWQLGESHYWGHNAIIRVAPFMEHCALGRLSGRGPLSGEILSHDFVEAALMRGAGWAVWIAYDLPGSYEEMPPTLLDELKRDRRWCLGNLINSRLLAAPGVHPAHRAVFLTGIMAYLSAPLWFLFLVLSTALIAVHTLVPPRYFVEPGQLFPRWPEWHLEWALALFTTTALLLFLPKVLSALIACAQGAQRYGGAMRLFGGVLLEMLLSMLLAPVRMVFHTQFVLSALTGLSRQWKSPRREDAETTWEEATRRHGFHTALGVAWMAFVFALDPQFVWWLAPIAGALAVSIPLSVYTSRVSLGRRLRASGIFRIPEEAHPPPELAQVARDTRVPARLPGFVEAAVDPRVNAFMCALAAPRARQPERLRAERLALARHACRSGPAALTSAERLALLDHAPALAYLHHEVWAAPSAHEAWRSGREEAPSKIFRLGADSEDPGLAPEAWQQT